MAEPARATLEIGHPAPHRNRVPNWLLFGAIGAGPTLWLAQLLIGFAFSSYLCFPDLPREPPLAVPSWMNATLIAANVIAILLTAASAFAGWRMLDRTSGEHEGQPGGMVDAGEGRTRFLAIWALVTSGLFLAAIVFNTINLVLVPSCLS
jgi:hypothetical protein